MTTDLETLDIKKITKAIENDENEYLLRFDNNLIQKMKNDILQKLQLDSRTLRKYNKSLKDYIYITDLTNLKEGSYIRWIPLRDPTKVKLTNGAHLIETVITNTGIQLKLKTTLNRFFNIKMDECIIFQKFNTQEKIILSLLNALNK